MNASVSPSADQLWRRWLDWRLLAFALFVVLTGFTSLHHEPWDDECHAFLMARELPLSELIFTYIPYEGTPPLWHLVLWCLTSAGGNLDAMRILSIAIAAIGTLLLLWRAPFPAGLKLLIPFGFWTAYQYSVVARSYVLIPILIYLVAIFWQHRLTKPFRMVLVLGLVASVSAHGFAVAGAFALVMTVELLRSRKTLPARQFRMASLALTGLLLFAGLIYALVRSPADITFPARNPGPPLLALKNAARAIIDQAWTPYRPLTLLVLVVSSWWFFRTRALSIWLIPTATLTMLLWLIWRQEWHIGMVYLVWLAALWISFENLKHLPSVGKLERWIATSVFAVGIGSQIAWTLQTAYLDWRLPYSGSHAVDQYLQSRNLATEPLAGVGFPCTSVQAYFPAPLFLNWNRGSPPSIWWWSERFDYVEKPLDLATAKPAAILRPIKPPIWRTNEHYPGYFKAAVFPGHMFFQDFIKEETSFEIWLPVKTSAP